MVEPIIPAVLEARDLPGDPVANAVRANVVRAVRTLRTGCDTLMSKPQAEGKSRIVGARYAPGTGHVDFLRSSVSGRTMRGIALPLAACAIVAGAAPARAQDHDAQLWTSTTMTTAVSGRIDATLELHSRYTDEVSRVGQVLIRPGVTLKLARGWSVTAGYVHVRTDFVGTAANDEHRTWQQVGYTFEQDAATGLLVTGRTRIEQRFRPDAAGTGWRLRQQLRAQLPLPGSDAIRAVVWNDTFVGLNTTPWDRHDGVDQVRTFIGVALPVAKGVTVEPGYLNQTVFRIGADRVNHIVAANVLLRF
ncbi:DUF2490 domain-containing protein [Sphingomonas sp. 2R-10]|uniref:DUF2490 domain-containing protein n=1 Tax=Sphingomonas sp. 2R-10 TaxID=3045148 RepID=UPI000F7AE83A|nr:DUF2490 domain-containing protein [Sphingomonas sp. 2R-10]MDJ0278188.1 DUF2490 domain-containing protein [Sphingomonas sp. 2R-10]